MILILRRIIVRIGLFERKFEQNISQLNPNTVEMKKTQPQFISFVYFKQEKMVITKKRLGRLS